MPDTDFFSGISLAQMDQVKLMNRTDKKFWFDEAILQQILHEINEHYYILRIDGKDKLPYSTHYFDTQKNQMYNSHHNGKLNRYKIRKRIYEQSGLSFLEIKRKTNKGRTIKTRIETNNCNCISGNTELEFINRNTPYQVDNLREVLLNNFTRITLVNKNFNERCTIDYAISFKVGKQNINLKDLVIVELKTDNTKTLSPLELALRKLRLRPSGFSKYCIGRSFGDSGVKQNAFKRKQREILKKVPQIAI